MEQLKGTGVALVTPFKEDFTVDVNALAAIVEHCIQGGVDYLVVLGTTGESATLTKMEKQVVIDTVIAANRQRLPLVLGIGGNHTQAVVEELQYWDLASFDAVLSVSPYYNKPTQEGIYQHFAQIAKASPKPIILYNVPGRTGSNMLPETTLRLARDFSNVVAIKEASGDMVQVAKIIKGRPEGFMVVSGDDFTALPTVLAGGEGVISVLGQGPAASFSNMIRAGLNREVDRAYALHYELMDGMELIFKEGNPAGIKTLMKLMGLCGDAVRLPLVSASQGLTDQISAFLQGQHSNILA